MEKIDTIYIRNNARFTKLLTLGILLYFLRARDGKMPQVKIYRSGELPNEPNAYLLDLGENEWRKRGYSNEIQVVVQDFGIPGDDQSPYRILAKLVSDHNTAAGKRGGDRPNQSLDNRPGSIQWLSAFAYDVMEFIHRGNHMRTIWDLEEDQGGRFLLDKEFMEICINIIFLRLDVMFGKGTKPGYDGSSSQINTILDTQLRGHEIREGLGRHFTVAGYIDDMCRMGKTVKAILQQVRPLLKLCDLHEQFMKKAQSMELKPFTTFDGGLPLFLIDLVAEPEHPAAEIPVVHNALIIRLADEDRAGAIILRKAENQIAIFTRRVSYPSVQRLQDAYNHVDGDDAWFASSGMVLYGTSARTDKPNSKIPMVEGKIGQTIVSMAVQTLKEHRGDSPLKRQSLR